jgi:outer membrane immunogenic protein
MRPGRGIDWTSVECVMKKILLGVGLALSVGTAQAADLPYSSAPYAVNSYSWMGPYIGANVGYEWGAVSNNPTRPAGLLGGIQGGYNWRYNQIVFGGEADIQITGADDIFAPWKFSNPWFSTLRGRAGIAMNNILFYGTLGLAIGGLRGETFAGLSESRVHTGWAGGLGVEVGINTNWSAKAEYLYMDLAERGYALTGLNNGYQMNLLRLGVNYHF